MFLAFYLLWTISFLSLTNCAERERLEVKKLRHFELMFKNQGILAFGDSLTKGLVVQNRNFSHHSYALELERKLNSSDVNVLETGINGELTSHMLTRLPKVVHSMDNIKLAIILGGSNDLGHRIEPDIILANLIRMHEIVHKANSAREIAPLTPVFSIALGIPQISEDWHISEETRLSVNKGLQEYAQRCSHLVMYRDFETLFEQKDLKAQHLWSDDKVHYSPEGYDTVGSLLYTDIVDFAYRLSLPVGEEGSLKSEKKFSMC